MVVGSPEIQPAAAHVDCGIAPQKLFNMRLSFITFT
jgi:hypothetical protein